MSNRTLTESNHEDRAQKIIPSRVDYNHFNYCSTCEIKYPKQVVRCNECRQKVRTKPWHRSKIVVFRRI